MLIDLHNHTWPRSHDSVLDPADLATRARAAGLDGICLTEHDNVWDPEEIERLAEDQQFLIIPGIEVSTDDGHILAFGVEKYTFGMHRIERLAKHVNENGGCMLAAHPYRRQMPWKDTDPEWQKALKNASENPAYVHCTGLEILNGRGKEKENQFSQDLAGILELPGTAGTDSHAIHDIGKVATYFESDRIESWQSLVHELKTGRFHAVDMESGQEISVPTRKMD